MNNDRNKNTGESNNEKISPKPDSETLHTTDPQENMEGPVSSLMHATGHSFDTNETKEEADIEKEKEM
ncbi:MAG TPA: hypothetical protein VER36_09275 [Flavisolibacter sp.]|nr:hypothetical protein [Flavisolibacter sp.]